MNIDSLEHLILDFQPGQNYTVASVVLRVPVSCWPSSRLRLWSAFCRHIIVSILCVRWRMFFATSVQHSILLVTSAILCYWSSHHLLAQSERNRQQRWRPIYHSVRCKLRVNSHEHKSLQRLSKFLRYISPSSAVVLNHISFHFLISLSDSSLFVQCPRSDSLFPTL